MGLGSLKEQKAFEKSIWEKVKRGGGSSFPRPVLFRTTSDQIVSIHLLKATTNPDQSITTPITSSRIPLGRSTT